MKTDVFSRVVEAQKLLRKAEDLLYEAGNILLNTHADPQTRQFVVRLSNEALDICERIEKQSWPHLEGLLRYDEEPEPEKENPNDNE